MTDTSVASNKSTVHNAWWQGALNISVRNRDLISEKPYNYVNSDVITGIITSQERAMMMSETLKTAAGFEKDCLSSP